MAFTVHAADLFCGAGGASSGLIRAVTSLGLDLKLLAINHWPVAVATHQLNHPGVRHLCESLERVSPREQVPSGRLHLLLAGPECTHHSQARGGKPINDQSRATAWCVVKWAQELYIDCLIIENVPEFRSWGPLGADGKPLVSMKGKTYQAYLGALRSLGYRIEERVVNAADYGDATTRQRLFLICHRGRKKVSFPQPTHAKVPVPGRRKWKAAKEVIDWSLTGQSIFTRKKPLERATVERILAGLDRFGGPQLQPFVALLRAQMAGGRLPAVPPSLVQPRGANAAVDPFLVTMRQHMDGRSIDQPVPTITAGGTHIGLAEPFLVTAGGPVGQGRNPNSVDEPLPTVLTENHRGVVQPFVMHLTHGARLHDVQHPLPTVTGAHRGELGVVEPQFVLSQASGGAPRSVEQPMPTLCTDGAVSLVQPFMVPLYSERPTQTPRTHGVEEPVPTIPATGGGKFGVVQPFMVSAGGPEVAPRSTEDPMNTVLTRDHMAVVNPFLSSYYGTLNISSCEQPVPTVTTKGRFALVMPVIDGMALDIRFRMLQTKELAGAMSFPKNYQFTGNQGDATKQIGNAWPGETAKALCLAALRGFVADVEDNDERRTA